MTDIPTDLRYSRDHEWVRVDGDTVTVGITDFAQQQLGDVVHVESPGVGVTLEAEAPFGTLESVKAVTETFLPVAGSILETNPELTDSPELINTDPYGEGWLIRVRPSGPLPDTLLDPDQYLTFIKEETSV